MSLDRRKFLASMLSTGAGCSALRLLFTSIAMGTLEKTLGAASKKRYIHIQEYEAPPRWMFDLFLNPLNQDVFQHTPFLGSRFVNVGGRYEKVAYETVERKGLHVPYMWQFDLPARGGGMRSMDTLLNNMLQIRGIDTLNPGHDVSSANWYRPPNWNIGTLSIAADQANNPIPCVALGNHAFTLASAKGLSPLHFNPSNAQLASDYRNLIKEIMNPFIFTDNEIQRIIRTQAQDAISDLESVSDSLLISRSAQYSDLVRASHAAKELIYGAVANVEQFWLDTIAKYQDLSQRSFTQALPGFDEYPVGTEDSSNPQQSINGQPAPTNDIRGCVGPETFVNGLAEYFTVTEYLLRNELSSSIAFSLRGTYNVKPMAMLTADEHIMGYLSSLYINTKRHRAIASCFLEFLDVIKGLGIFNDTLVLMAGEFNRNVRNDGTGTDHGFDAASACLYSGTIEGPYVMGNIGNMGEGDRWIGTYGRGARNVEVGSRLDINYIPPTVASFMGTALKGINDKYLSLVQIDAGKAVPRLGRGVLVDQRDNAGLTPT